MASAADPAVMAARACQERRFQASPRAVVRAGAAYFFAAGRAAPAAFLATVSAVFFTRDMGGW